MIWAGVASQCLLWQEQGVLPGTIYPGKVGSAKTFRLCALGQIDEPDIADFFKVLKSALDEYKIEVRYNG